MRKISVLFVACMNLRNEMDRLLDDESDKYFEMQTQLQEMLNSLLDHKDFLDLSKQQIIDFLDMCSSHRPCQLHVLLDKISSHRYRKHLKGKFYA